MIRTVAFLFLLLGAGLAEPSAELQQEMTNDCAQMAYELYEEAVAAAQKLETAVVAWSEAPSPERLEKARKAWRQARTPYLQTESLRYFASPVDDDDGPIAALDSWQVNETFLQDLLKDEAGHPDFTMDELEELNQKDDLKNVACGYHAVEYFLWKHPVTGPDNRRTNYLKACLSLLVRDLQYVAEDWKQGPLGNYRAMFVEGPDMAVQRLITGMTLLSGFQLATSRLQVPLDSQQKIDSPSYFSDSAREDLITSMIGMQNFWTGNRVRQDGSVSSGKGLRAVAVALDPLATKQLDSLIEQNVKLAKQMTEPFSKAIAGEDESPSRKTVARLIMSLEDQSELLRGLARKVGYEVPQDPDSILE